MHRGKALALVSKSLAKSGQMPGDDTLAAVALLAGYEVSSFSLTPFKNCLTRFKLLFGTPQNFNTHMDGLTSMLNMRGGLETFKNTNPTLHSVVSWFDYSGSCNLVAIRRYVPCTREFDILSTNPTGAPHAIISRLPDGYDVRQTIADLFKGLKTVISVLWSSVPNESQRAESSEFINRVDSELYRSICAPEQEGNRSRRRHVLQSYHILILISTTIVSRMPLGASSDIRVCLDILEITLTTESERWGNAVIALLQLLFSGISYDFQVEEDIKKVIDASLMLTWDEWASIKRVLLRFFVDDETCQGRLQTLWKGRLAAISAQIS